MKIYPALFLLAATFSAHAVEYTVDFEGTEPGPCNPEPMFNCGFIDKPFLFFPHGFYVNVSTVPDPRNPSGAVLRVADDEGGAGFKIFGSDGSNISRFAIQSFDVFMFEHFYPTRLTGHPLSEQDQQLFAEQADGEWHTVTLEEPVYTDEFSLGVNAANEGGQGYFDNIVVDVVWGSFDIAGIADLSSDAQPDFTLLPRWGYPTISGVASADGGVVESARYFPPPWEPSSWAPIAQDVVIDGNGDGVADDPLVALLGQNRGNSEIDVETLSLSDDSQASDRLSFFNEQYEPIDVAVLNDTNGDGVPNDPSIAVLAEKPATGRQAIMLRRLNDGVVLGHWTISKQNQELVALAAVGLPGNNSRLSVLTRDTVTGRSSIHSFRAADGARAARHNVLKPADQPKDLAIQADGDANGIADDPLYVVLSEKGSNGKQMASLSDALTGEPINEFRVLNANWTAHSIAVSPDLSGDGFPDLLTAATRDENGRLVINVRELDSGDRVTNLFPKIPNPAIR